MRYFFGMILVVFFVSCGTFKATVNDVSEYKQEIEVDIFAVSFDSNEPLIERLSISITNLSSSSIEFIPEKCFFQDERGFHYLKIPPVKIPVNQKINFPIESIDYYIIETNAYGNKWGFSSNSSYSMQDLNVGYLLIHLRYKMDDIEQDGVFEINVERIETNY